MGDVKVKGYRLKGGDLFIPYGLNFNYSFDKTTKITTLTAQYLNTDLNELVGGYHGVKVGNKVTFDTGNYLEVKAVTETQDTYYNILLKYFACDMKDKNGNIIVLDAINSPQGGSLLNMTDLDAHGKVKGTNIEASMVYSQKDGHFQVLPKVTYDSLKNGGVATIDGKYGYLFSSPKIKMDEILKYAGEEEEDYITYKGDTSGDGGYGGSFDDSTDTIGLPDLPSISASSCGFVDMFKLTLAQTKSLSNFLWSSADEITEHLKKIFSNPMDAIISISLVNISLSGESTSISLGGLPTGVTGQKISSQFATVDCGSITVPLYWGTALDYSPNAKSELYLPCIGSQTINIDDILGKTMHIVYHCDLLSGACIAYVLVNESVYYQFSGNVITQVPYTSENNMELYKSVLSTVGAVATGGVSAITSGVNVMQSKPDVQRGGTISGNTGALCIKKPFLTLTRAVQSLPKNYQGYKGFPSNIYANFSDLSGYTEVESVQLQGMTATAEEKAEIEQLLKSGVIF